MDRIEQAGELLSQLATEETDLEKKMRLEQLAELADKRFMAITELSFDPDKPLSKRCVIHSMGFSDIEKIELVIDFQRELITEHLSNLGVAVGTIVGAIATAFGASTKEPLSKIAECMGRDSNCEAKLLALQREHVNVGEFPE